MCRLIYFFSLSSGDATRLFTGLAGPDTSVTDDRMTSLCSALNSSPYGLALAGLTVRLYTHFLQSAEGGEREGQSGKAVAMFTDALSDSVSRDGQDTAMDKVTDLYLEAVSTVDLGFMLSVDYLAVCDLDYPVLLSSIGTHLRNPYNKLPSQTPLLLWDTTATPSQVLTPPRSYVAVMKSKIPFLNNDQETKLPENLMPKDRSVDLLASLTHSPFIRVSSLAHHNLELVHVHPLVVEKLKNRFLTHTVPRMEEDQIVVETDKWNRTAWFKRFRSFSPENVLARCRGALPGISGGGVWTEEQFKTRDSRYSYRDYLHLISLYHRFVDSITGDLKYLSRDTEDMLIRRYVEPHLVAVSRQPMLTEKDRLQCQSGILSLESAMSVPDQDVQYGRYEELLMRQKACLGSRHVEVANTLTAMADIKSRHSDLTSAKTLLLSALSIHEGLSRQYKDNVSYSMDYAASLSALGLLYAGSEGDKISSRSTLEKALQLFQTIPTDGEVTRRQRKVVATAVTDVSHAYISTGDTVSAKRYLDLAVMAQRGIHGDCHPEVFRTLNIQSIMYSLTGNNEDSRNVRKEAGKIQTDLEARSDII